MRAAVRLILAVAAALCLSAAVLAEAPIPPGEVSDDLGAAAANLLAMPMIEPVPEHAFGWIFEIVALCHVEPGTPVRRTGEDGTYRGVAYVKVRVLGGACRDL